LTEGQKKVLIGVLAGLAVLLIVGAGCVVYLFVQQPVLAQTWRDIFIIFMAFEFMFIGAALAVLMIQLAVLTNLLKNEVSPILQATQETVSTVRGTAVFVSENITEPVIKLNSYLAGLEKVLSVVSSLGGILRKL
jgi:uncharacterized membrane protein